MKTLPSDINLQQYADEFYFDGGEPKETNVSRIVYLYTDWFSDIFWLEDEDHKVVKYCATRQEVLNYCKENNLDLREK